MVIGAVSDGAAGAVVGVSVVDVTTEVSVVGNAPGEAAALGAGDGAVADWTTDVSSVGNLGAALAAGEGEAAAAIGEGSGCSGAFSSFMRSIFAC